MQATLNIPNNIAEQLHISSSQLNWEDIVSIVSLYQIQTIPEIKLSPIEEKELIEASKKFSFGGNSVEEFLEALNA